MKRSPINKVSKRRAKENAVYKRVKRAYMALHPLCEGCNSREAQDIHHKRGRGIYLCEQMYFMAVCHICHRAIHNNPTKSRELGYLLDRLAK